MTREKVLHDLGFGDDFLETSLVAQMMKNPLAMQETRVRFLAWEDPLERGIATHSSILAWRIYEQRRLAGYSPWDQQRVGRNRATEHTFETLYQR